MSYTASQVEKVLTAASKNGFIIVGGQAINGWSEELQVPKREPWLSLSPYTSHDIDCFADIGNLPSFVKEIQSLDFSVEIQLLKNDFESKHNVAALWISGKGLSLEINCLRNVIGISSTELKSTAQESSKADCSFLLMHPLLCIESKAHNLAYLPQEGRQDEKHLRLSIGNLHSYLLKFNDAAASEQIVHRIIDLSLSSHGVSIYRNYKINFLDAIPWTEWQDSENPTLKNIGSEHSLHEHNFQKIISEEIETEKWLNSLNPKTHRQIHSPGHLSRYPHLHQS